MSLSSISFWLSIVFSPLTIMIKMIRSDSDGLRTILSILACVITTALVWIFVAPSASPLFYIISTLMGFMLTIFFYFKIEDIEDKLEWVPVIFFLVAGLVAGYTLGMFGFAFLLLY